MLLHIVSQATIAQGNEAGPHKLTDTMAFMFESCLIPRVCHWALDSPAIDPDYYKCWIGLRSHFSAGGMMDQIEAAWNHSPVDEDPVYFYENRWGMKRKSRNDGI